MPPGTLCSRDPSAQKRQHLRSRLSGLRLSRKDQAGGRKSYLPPLRGKSSYCPRDGQVGLKFSLQIPEEGLPGILMLHIVQRTQFPAHVIVPQYIFRFQIVFTQKPAHQMQKGLISCLGKGTVLRRVAAFNGNGIVIPGLYPDRKSVV